MSSIKKIVLEVGGVELSLSPEDAKTLQAALNELFPAPVRRQIQYVPSPYPVYPSRPYWYTYDSGVRLMSSTGSGTAPRTLNLSSSSVQGYSATRSDYAMDLYRALTGK